MAEDKKKAEKKLIARRDHHLVHPTSRRIINVQIRKGDDIEELGVPRALYDALKTEGVI